MTSDLPHAGSLKLELEAHRDALDGFLNSARALEAETWNAPRPGGDWSPAQIAEHLRLTYATILADLSGQAGFRIRTRWWQRQILRFRFLPGILRKGVFPPGTPATREVRPGPGPFDQPQLLSALDREAERFLQAAAKAPGRTAVAHPFFGQLRLPDAVRLLTQHLRHHHAQIGGPAQGSGN